MLQFKASAREQSPGFFAITFYRSEMEIYSRYRLSENIDGVAANILRKTSNNLPLRIVNIHESIKPTTCAR